MTCITETLAKARKYQDAFGRDLELEFFVDLGLNRRQVISLARMGEIRFAGSVK